MGREFVGFEGRGEAEFADVGVFESGGLHGVRDGEAGKGPGYEWVVFK